MIPRSRRVGVVGSMGQLGSDVVQVLSESGRYEVSPLSHNQIDVTDRKNVMRVLTHGRFEAVVNCAAFTRVDECEDRPGEAFQVNALGAHNVASVCAELDALCIYISTDYIFDGVKRTPYMEEDTPRPLSVYGLSKLAGEYFVRNLCPKHFVVRTSGLYGVVGSSGKGGNFVEIMIRLAKERRPIRVVNDQVLTPTYAKDLAQKIKELLQTDAYGLYHITNSGQCSWYDFAGKIFELLGLRPDFGPTTTTEFGAKARRPAYSVLAHHRLRQLGLDDLRPWPEGLYAYLIEKGYLS